VILFGAIVFCVLQAKGMPELWFLRTNAATFFARISYALYLVHGNVLLITFMNIGDGAASVMLAFIVSVLLCAASYRYFEAPLIKMAGHKELAQSLPSPDR
jgi:peptidoglycan/LPS O-acetylase OafA/YrhL